MPKAPAKRGGHAKATRSAPIPTEKTSKGSPKGKSEHKPRDPTHSHLYTDDNPSTTIHGTGFKDAEAARRTLDLISKRSLTYQFQTVNTMFHRAKHHPAMKAKKSSTEGEEGGGSGGMKEAMAIFREWLDQTYPALKTGMRGEGGFKPLLSKKTVEKYLPQVEASSTVSEDGKSFAGMYVSLGKGKRLGNVLVDDSKPTESDWEAKRYAVLCELVREGKEDIKSWKNDELWEGDKQVSDLHLQLIAWAWSPLQERKLP
ncbi:hypothetical protein B0A50_04264 [Salinomyces thailandicus]|uniref:Uncharacterized protein n=1 Tax=Salinomyces thailandicus TaxID=706561 RepID=A0A4U0TWS0_9PEZI|nr:hypothetical protein B0A50_04264 [Salinomyces thailandica]